MIDSLLGDTFVERSCGTLLQDTLVGTLAGHTCGTLTYDTHVQMYFRQFWGHSSQQLLPALHLYYKAASSTAPRSWLPHYTCTTKWPVLRPQLSEATFALPSGQFWASVLYVYYQVACPEGAAPRSCFPHCIFATSSAPLWDTLAGHSCGTLLWTLL